MSMTEPNDSQQVKQSAGRPRDPDLEGRVFDAAIDLYAQGGWSALTMSAVAKEAKVGKAALYRRWSGREALFADMLEARWISVETIDTGAFRTDLQALARLLFDLLASPNGNVMRYLQADALQYREVRQAMGPYITNLMHMSRAIVKRAAHRGDVAPSVDATLILDVIMGALSNHVITTPPRLKSQMLSKSQSYIERLVDMVVDSVPGI